MDRRQIQLPLFDSSENKMAEIERLSADRRTLAIAHVSLRQELAAAQQEVEKLKERIKSTTKGSDIETQVLSDKISKMAVKIRAGDSLKKDLQQAQMETLQLLAAKRELTSQIQQATKELDKAREVLMSLPEKHKELHSLRQEHQRLRTSFEYERAVNIEKVMQMQAMEKSLLSMSSEVESLRAELLNAENRANVSNSYTTIETHPNLPHQPDIHTNYVYVDMYGRPCAQVDVGTTGEGIYIYGNGNSLTSYATPYGQMGLEGAVEGVVPYASDYTEAASSYIGQAPPSSAF